MSNLKLNSAGGGSVTLSVPSTSSARTLTLPDLTDTVAVTNQLGIRNKIINGAMMIDQRNAGASVTPTTDQTYALDRWVARLTQASKFSVQQVTDAPSGFYYSIKCTSLSAYSVGASDFFGIAQYFEGLNTVDLNWGTSNASTVTISFWVKSSLTGTFGGTIFGFTSGYPSYPFSYSISQANTWEYKTITIAGPTSGSFVATSAGNIVVYWGLGVGSSLSGTANTWNYSTLYRSPTGATSVVGTNGATFYITGVQLEKGATATPFENRLYWTELALCQRYYWQVNSETSYAGLGSGVMNTATTARIFMPYPVSMRAAPTVSITSPSSFMVSQGTDLTPTNLTPYANSKTCMFDMATGTGTVGRGAVLLFANASTGSIQATAEL